METEKLIEAMPMNMVLDHSWCVVPVVSCLVLTYAY